MRKCKCESKNFMILYVIFGLKQNKLPMNIQRQLTLTLEIAAIIKAKRSIFQEVRSFELHLLACQQPRRL